MNALIRRLMGSRGNAAVQGELVPVQGSSGQHFVTRAVAEDASEILEAIAARLWDAARQFAPLVEMTNTPAIQQLDLVGVRVGHTGVPEGARIPLEIVVQPGGRVVARLVGEG